MQEEEEWIDDDDSLQAEPEGATQSLSSAGVIIVDNADVGSIKRELAHRSRQDS